MVECIADMLGGLVDDVALSRKPPAPRAPELLQGGVLVVCVQHLNSELVADPRHSFDVTGDGSRVFDGLVQEYLQRITAR